jgi:hypothetical protein
MTDSPQKPSPPDNDPANQEPSLREQVEDYDYLIDPLTGLPELELTEEQATSNDERPLRVGRASAPTPALEPEDQTVIYRAASSDPLFGYIVAMAVSFGLMPLLPDGAPMRFTIAWGLIAAFGVVAWLLGNGEQIGQEAPENLAWGVFIGVLAGTPLYLFGGSTLGTTAKILFDTVTPGALLAYLVFVMPLGETLFFRGILQHNRNFWVGRFAGDGLVCPFVLPIDWQPR